MRYIRLTTLEQFCLHVIVENLEKFIYNRNIPQKHIDFLLRVYSEDVFKKFTHRQQVSEDGMLWFLNPHSKKISLNTVSEKIISQLQIIGSTITFLSLKESPTSEKMLDAILSCIPHVTHLDLSCSQCTDSNLLCLQRMCPALVSLNLRNCRKISSAGMGNLCGVNRLLSKLDLTGTDVGASGINKILKGFPLLKQFICLDMAEALYEIHEGLGRNNVQYNLTELIYRVRRKWIHVADVLNVWTILCPYVTKIHFTFPVTKQDLKVCSRFKCLEDLSIYYCAQLSDILEFQRGSTRFSNIQLNEDILAPMMPKSSIITTLRLCDLRIPIKTLLICFENVKTLCLQRVEFPEFLEDDRMQKENKLEVLHLEEIYLADSSTSKAILFLLSVSKNVQTLYLKGMRFIPENIYNEILHSMKNLSFISFGHSSINLLSVRRFFQLPSLTKINVDGSTESSRLFNQFSAVSKTNSLSWCKWDDDGDSDSDSDFNNDIICCMEFSDSESSSDYDN